MPSPAKKRKLNAENAKSGQPRGLEYFFSKQREVASPAVNDRGPKEIKGNEESLNTGRDEDVAANPLPEGGDGSAGAEMTDEELARKLQAEWDEELRQEQQQQQQEVVEAPVQIEAAKMEEYVPTADEDTPRLDSPATTALPLLNADVPSTSVPSSLPAPGLKNTLSLQSVTTADDLVTATIPLDESPLTFDTAKYIPLLKKQWQGNAPSTSLSSTDSGATYSLLTRCFVLVNATQSRIKIVDTLVNCLRLLIEADPASLLPAVWLATNAIGPPYAASLELGLGGSAISRALKQVCGLDARSLKALYDKHGDPGDVAYEAKKKQSFTLRRPRPLTIRGVYGALKKIAGSRGTGSAETKQRIVDRLLQDARGGDESRYIVRTLCQHLRIGAVKTTMLIALSRAFILSQPPPDTIVAKEAAVPRKMYAPSTLAGLKKEELTAVWAGAEEIVKACFARRPNYDDLVPALLDHGVCDDLPVLARCGLALHIPLRPMLGSITRDLGEMLAKLQGRSFTCEYKYDGQRAQVHANLKDKKVSIFSRHLENMTDKYPDLVSLVPQFCSAGVDSFILEGEVVAVDAVTGKLQPFQTLTSRARKDVELGSVTVNVCLYAFDLMFLNGEPLLDRPMRARRELLRSLFVEVPRQFTWVQSMDATSDDGDAISEFFRGAVNEKCEGIMVKVLDSGTVEVQVEEVVKTKSSGKAEVKIEAKTRRKPLLATYEPDKRLDSWLKVKKDYGATSDTLDLVPIAAWHGMGRKAKWWSPILMAKDKNVKTANNTRRTKPAYVDYYGPEPDVWFEPNEVWEMAFADITLSPTYTAAIGLVSEARGLSLRFPRFLRKRPDKGIDEASSSTFLANLFRKQAETVHDTQT
ncbi:dna ligase [Ophiostoma piceae UAMH 11346]|uniref:DNA ligase n=1 Tax=Ophiostoma piceae (strain UAMH 11346) TaxID=1262450 RepID=S3CFQ7_OPHP1|nr:dna ligase [Ophiostoma piceae UAMH 11346]